MVFPWEISDSAALRLGPFGDVEHRGAVVAQGRGHLAVPGRSMVRSLVYDWYFFELISNNYVFFCYINDSYVDILVYWYFLK